jgi:hypothetical protein
MTETKSPFFRDNALQHYLQSQEKAVLPRFVSPPVFACLWFLLGLLGAAGSVAWLAEIPIVVTGTAVIMTEEAASVEAGLVAVVFLPPEILPDLQPNQPLSLYQGSEQPESLSLFQIEPGVHSPREIRERWMLDSTAVRQPAAVALARFDSSSLRPATDYAGSQFTVEVKTGSRRVFSFLPLIGRFFQ